MRLESALNAGREGITAHGGAISVIGDNIANSNTTGFKTSRTEFSDILSEGVEGTQSDNIPYTGTGVSVGKVRTLISQGGVLEQTGRVLDAAVDGNGFFVLGSPASSTYTRAGNFNLDSTGKLVSSNGKSVLGYQGTSTTLSEINLYNLNLTGAATTKLALSGNISSTSTITAKPTKPATFNELASVTASFVAPSTVYDSLGAAHSVTLGFFKTGVNKYDVAMYADAGDTGGTKGTPVELGKSTVTFTENGTVSGAASIASSAAWSNGAAAGNFAVDLTKFTQFASNSSVAGVTQDGRTVGNVKSYEIDDDGSIFAVLDSGAPTKVGSIALATFRNVDGLDRTGSAEYVASTSAGAADIGLASSGTRGNIKGGTLESSTVDLSDQFVNLVIYQRGYQANSQSINSVNDMYKDTIQLMR